MSGNINQNCDPLYKETESLQSYGSAVKDQEDASVKYEIYTMDEYGHETLEEMSEEETLQTIKEISVHYGDHAVVEFSGDGMAALIESTDNKEDETLFEEQVVIHEAQNTTVHEEIMHYESLHELPVYSGLYEADKAVATAVEHSSKKEQAFVYGIICRNFLIKNRKSLSEKERQASISLGMKKAEYAAVHFLSKENTKMFMEAMELIAKLASAGISDSSGTMDYGVKKGSYLGHGKNLIDTANPVDMMRRMDTDAYNEYQKLCEESNREDKLIHALKYLSNWYSKKVLKDPSMLHKYNEQSEKYVEKNVINRTLDTTFAALRTGNKAEFLEDLEAFHSNQPDFLGSVIKEELLLPFWRE